MYFLDESSVLSPYHAANPIANIAPKTNSRNTTSNEIDKHLFAHGNNAEGSTAVDFVSNGFKIRSSSGGINGSGSTFIYMAFGQSLVGSNNVPCTAR